MRTCIVSLKVDWITIFLHFIRFFSLSIVSSKLELVLRGGHTAFECLIWNRYSAMNNIDHLWDDGPYHRQWDPWYFFLLQISAPVLAHCLIDLNRNVWCAQICGPSVFWPIFEREKFMNDERVGRKWFIYWIDFAIHCVFTINDPRHWWPSFRFIFVMFWHSRIVDVSIWPYDSRRNEIFVPKNVYLHVTCHIRLIGFVHVALRPIQACVSPRCIVFVRRSQLLRCQTARWRHTYEYRRDAQSKQYSK